jgi:DNA polymerase delta subunit 1
MADTVLHHSPGPNRWFFLGRLWGEPTPLKSSSFASNAHGHKVTHTFGMTGRLTVDALEIIRRDGTKKFRSYTLDFLASQILNKGKAGLTPDQIFGHYEGNATDRGVVAAYCAVDCDLVLELLLRLCTLQNVWEMAKITYTTPQDIVSQGQQIKVFHQIVWDAHRQSDARTQSDGFMANDPQNITVADYKGATVLEPQPGYYVEPITTLDFASLYPSIIIQHNLCMSTWVNNPDHLNIPGASYKTIDLGDGRQYTFVTHIPGILPTILKRLLAARSKVKKQMEKETDSFLVSILDAKQLALKVSCNSVYGFCGVALSSAKYPCMAVSESTTYFGRQMIATLKETIETRYPNSEVVYGDTDSVMIRFPVQNHPAPVKECFRLGSEVADLAHQMFGEHVNLTMEKVFQPYLLVCKKRYAGMSFTHPDKPAKLKISGLEVVRRDFAILVCKTQEAVLKAILEEQNVEKGKQIIWNKLNDLVENKIPFEEFVITCQLAAKYKNPNQLQTVLVDKMRERTPGSEPKSGDRIQYVVTEHKDQKAPISTKAEDAAYAQQHNVALDKLHYLTHMERPLSVLIEAMGHDAKRMFDHFRAKLHNQRHHLQDLRQYLVPRATGSDTVVSPSNATKPPTQITTKRKTASKPLNRFQQAAKAKQPDPRQPSLVSMLTPKRKI